MSKLNKTVAGLWLLAVLCGTAPAVAAGDGINNGGSGSSSSSSSIISGTTPCTGCASGGVLFNNGGVVTGDSGLTYGGVGAGAPVAIAQGTITTNIKALNITATWNAAGTTFDAPIFLNVTNTASAAGSLLADFQVGGASQFSVRKDGATTIGVGAAITSSGAGGALGSNAFTSTAYAPLASPTFSGTITFPDSGTYTSSALTLGSASNFNLSGNINLTNIGKAIGWNNRTQLLSGTDGTLNIGNFAGSNQGTITAGAAGLLTFGASIAATLSSATGTNVVCNTPGAGTVLTVQIFATGCVASSARFKQNFSPITDKVALDVVTRLQSLSYNYRSEFNMGDDIHFGFTAEQVREIDPNLITYEVDGITPHAVKYNELWAFVAGAIRAVKADNDNIRAEVEALRRSAR